MENYQKMITHKNTDPRYGIRVKTCRVEKHLSQEQLGDAIGTSKPYICKIENAKQSLTSDMAKRLSEVLGVRWEYLMLLEHMIISHHGEAEFGSPKPPMFPEAEMLHWIDLVDARMNEMNGILRRTPAGALSEKIWSLDRRVYHPMYTDDAE